jgi:transposase InsO family protein
MKQNMEIIAYVVSLMIKAAVVAARYSGRVRKRSLKRLAVMDIDDKNKEILFLKDRLYELETQNSILLKRVNKHQKIPHYTLRERLFILWHMETFQIPRRKVSEHLGVSRSTLYRWLHKIQDDDKQMRIPVNKTPEDIVVLIWEITKSNINWGRVRIANQLALLNIFISASTVRNVLNKPQPRNPEGSSANSTKTSEKTEPKHIPAWYPNHVWSIDTTDVRCWGLWPIKVFVAIDHFSRKVMTAAPLEGPNAGWVYEVLESTISKYGAPKHIISDQAKVFTGDLFEDLLDKYHMKQRLGAIGKHGSICVSERVNKTLKYEWLKHVPFIKSFDHLAKLCDRFEQWYNTWRPHMALDGHRPDDVYYDRNPKKPERDSKTVPHHIQRHLFKETRVTGYRLTDAA